MRFGRYILVVSSLVFIVSLFSPLQLIAGNYVVDKALCKQLVTSGNLAMDSGNLSEAKDYFQKAVQADPMSETAWKLFEKSLVAYSGGTLPSESENEEEEEEEEWNEGC